MAVSLTWADPDALVELQKLSEKPEITSDADYWLGRIYEDDDIPKAVSHYETAASSARSDKERVRAVIRAARTIYEMDQNKGFLRIIRELAETEDPEALKSYYSTLARLYERSGDHRLSAVALEKLLEVAPNDTHHLFLAAYLYAQEEFYPIAMHHYRKLLGFSPDNATALNNLGIVCRRLDMPMRSITAYRRSAELNETLAMANLAYLYIESGFEKEAQTLLNEAKTKETVHPNVGRALATLAEKKEEEEQTEARASNDAREEQRVLRAFGDAYFKCDKKSPSFSGHWQASNGVEVEITQQEEDLTGTWTTKTGWAAFGSDERKSSLRGKAYNRGATIHVEEVGTLLGTRLVGKGYAYLSPEGKELHTLTIKESEHRILKFTRKS